MELLVYLWFVKMLVNIPHQVVAKRSLGPEMTGYTHLGSGDAGPLPGNEISKI